MPRKTARRSISLKGTTYVRLKRHCDALDVSVSGWCESLINKALDDQQRPTVSQEEAREVLVTNKADDADECEPIINQHFTF